MTRIKYKETARIEAKRGRPAIGRKPEKKELIRRYVKESMSIREVADHLGCSKDMVYRTLKENGIELRPAYNRSRLRKYKLSILEEGVREKGVRGCAKELGVHENTLRYYLKGVKTSE